MSKIIYLGLIIFFCSQKNYAQKDTLVQQGDSKKSVFSATVLPLSLILTGSVLSGSLTDKTFQRDIRNKVGNDYHNSIDDYIQYVPYAQIYIGDAVGLKAKNHWFDQTKNIFITGIATTVIVGSFKRIIGKERPDGSSNHSFPSGHTANTFAGATILYHEFKDAHPAYAVSGYLFSATTGSFRVMNNKHYVSDVLAGAGVGILIVNLVYLIEPLKNWNPFKSNNNLTFSPVINADEVTFVASFKF